MGDSLEITRRRLPHWQMTGSTYFVTWRLALAQPDFTEPERDLVSSTLKYFQYERYRLYCYVVMNDHVHCLVEPQQDRPLRDILHSWKSFAAHALVKQHRRTAPIWLDESYDRIVRDEEELMQKAMYIVTNPQRRWPGLHDYQWVEWFSFD
jgi:putative transposase